MDDTYDEPDRRERDYSRSPRRDRDRSASPNGRAGDSHAPPAYGRRSPIEEQNAGTNLFVTGLSSSLRDDELRELFQQHGEVENASIVRDPHSRDSRGFGFVNMVSPEDADIVIEKLNGFELQGRNISIEKAKRNRPRTPTPGRYQGPPKRDMRRGGFDRRGPPRRDDYRSYPRSGDRYSGDRYERGGDRGFDRGGERGDRGGDRGGDRRYRDRSDGYGGSSRGEGYGQRRDDRERYGSGSGGGAGGAGGAGGGGYGYRDEGYAPPAGGRSYDERR